MRTTIRTTVARKRGTQARAALIALAAGWLAAGGGGLVHAQTGGYTYQTLVNFGVGDTTGNTPGDADGTNPYAGVTLANGVLYGTTQGGGGVFDAGANNIAHNGTMYQYNLSTGTYKTDINFGQLYQKNVLLQQNQGAFNGSNPTSAPVVGPDGILYGTSVLTASGASPGGYMYRYDPTTGAYTLGAAFNPGFSTGAVVTPANAGTNPLPVYNINGSTAIDNMTSIGDSLYGTTRDGGAFGLGSIFKYTPSTGAVATLADFGDPNAAGTLNSPGFSGVTPNGNLVVSSSGVFYGTTNKGNSNIGSTASSTVFSYNPNAKPGSRNFTLFTFPTDSVLASVALSPDGKDLYCLTYDSNSRSNVGGGYGQLYKISPTNFLNPVSILETFGIGSITGANPHAAMTFDAMGNLFGTTQYGGTNNNGTVFEYTPATNTYSTLFDFGTVSGAGANPVSSLTMDSAGNLYGTTLNGGPTGNGTLFELARVAAPEASPLALLGVGFGAGLLGLALTRRRYRTRRVAASLGNYGHDM